MSIENLIKKITNLTQEINLQIENIQTKLNQLQIVNIISNKLNTNLTDLNLDFFKEGLLKIEEEKEVLKDLKDLNDIQEVYPFLIDSSFENTGNKKEYLDLLENLKMKINQKFLEKNNYLNEELIKLTKLKENYLKLNHYLTNLNNLSYQEIESLYDLIEILEINLEDKLEIIKTISKINLKNFLDKKVITETPLEVEVTQENMDDFIRETEENERLIKRELQKEDDDLYTKKTNQLLELIKETKIILEENQNIIEEFNNLDNNIQVYIRNNDIISATATNPWLDFNSLKLLVTIINELLDLQDLLEFDYDRSTIDDIIISYKEYLNNYKEGLKKYQQLKEKITEEEKQEVIEVIDEEKEDYDDDFNSSDIKDFPTFLSTSKNMFIFALDSNGNNYVENDLNSGKNIEILGKKQGLLKTISIFSRNYVGRGVINSSTNSSKENKNNRDKKVYKNLKSKDYDEEFKPRRFRPSYGQRTGYLIIPVCKENCQKIFDLYGNENILQNGRIVMFIGVIYTTSDDKSDYDKVINKHLYNNQEYIRKVKELFINKDTRKEELKEIIDNGMSDCYNLIKSLTKPKGKVVE